ncbi:MAG TPA: hypothetical protein VM618_03360 [Acidimicrobiia bacterium]|nr:hypothetical protein [Acidimicrobiia bacterium]
MRRRCLVALAAVVAVVATVAVAPSGGAAASFAVRARSFPIEPAPGQNQLSLAVAPLATDIGLAPGTAFGRSAMLDSGFVENHPDLRPPDDSFVTCDTSLAGDPGHAERTVGAARLAVSCSDDPAGDGRVEGVSLVPFGLDGGVVATRSQAEATGGLLSAVSDSTVTGLAVGPLSVREARFVATVSADGTPGGAAADWDVELAGATVNGVPVVVTHDGVTVDTTEVPQPLVAEATRSIQEGFARSPYADVRVVQPAVEVSDDGRLASIDGGGIEVLFQSSDDPAERRFAGLTLLGGAVSVLWGDRTLDASPAAGKPASGGVVGSGRGGSTAPTVAGASARPAPSGRLGTTATPPARGATGDAGTVVETLELSAASGTRGLPTGTAWWLVVLVAGLAVMAAAAVSSTPSLLPARRRVEAWWDDASERYLRG